MIRSRAFTLVELVVVAGVICLLAAMLLPSLARGRESARQSSCASNLHQVGLGITMYAHAYRGWLPPYHASLHYRWPNQSYIAYNKKPIGPGPWNLAYLYECRFTRDASVFYCPSQRHQDHEYDTYPTPLGGQAPAGKVYIFTSYSYNPYVDDPGGEGHHLYDRLDRFPLRKILALEIPFAWSTAHQEDGQWGWNMLHGDGHAELRRSREASACIRVDPILPSDWTAFGELMAILER